MNKPIIIPAEELPIDPETGYRIPPDYVSTVTANGAGHAMGYRGQVYPSGTFSENINAFTEETALLAVDKGREKKQQAIRDAIEEEYDVPLELVVGNTVVTFMKQIVENEDVSPRSRLDTLDFIIEHTGLGEVKGQLVSGQPVLIDGITPKLAGQIRELIVLASTEGQSLLSS